MSASRILSFFSFRVGAASRDGRARRTGSPPSLSAARRRSAASPFVRMTAWGQGLSLVVEAGLPASDRRIFAWFAAPDDAGGEG